MRSVHDCVGALLVRDGAVLLGKRASDRDWLAGAWDVFGGHIEAGESEQDALRRELDEELGIVPVRMQRLDTISGDAPEPWRLHLYVVAAWQGTPCNLAPDEHAELRWCTLAEAQQRLGAAHPDFPRLLALALASAG
jgi:8-oxo-dGTP diphosphatase